MSDLAQNNSGDAVQAQLAKLRKKYGMALPDKIAGIETAVAALGPTWEEPVTSTAYRQVHSLAGSSGTYGFPGISSIARAAEAILKTSVESRTILPAADRTKFGELLGKLREMAADAARQASG
jgi:HPt (histidine-containing phosphotransfer) domain-containing protein